MRYARRLDNRICPICLDLFLQKGQCKWGGPLKRPAQSLLPYPILAKRTMRGPLRLRVGSGQESALPYSCKKDNAEPAGWEVQVLSQLCPTLFLQKGQCGAADVKSDIPQA